MLNEKSKQPLKRNLDTTNETSHVFHLPVLLQVGAWDDLGKRVEVWQRRVNESEAQLQTYQREIDDIAFRLSTAYGTKTCERLNSQPSAEEKADDGEEESESLTLHRKPLTADLLAYALGASLGRWGLRYATGEKSPPELPDPFALLPVCPPGMLQNTDGLPAASEDVSTDYPLEIVWNGILVDVRETRAMSKTACATCCKSSGKPKPKQSKPKPARFWACAACAIICDDRRAFSPTI